MKLRKVIPAGIVAVALAVSACSSTVTTSSVVHPKPLATHSVTHAPTLREQLKTWYLGPGGSDWKMVVQDVTKLSNDASANNQSATEADGAVLSADAQTAGSDPIPGPAGQDYVKAMQDYTLGGTAASTGDFTTAGADIGAGNTFLERSTTALKNYGG